MVPTVAAICQARFLKKTCRSFPPRCARVSSTRRPPDAMSALVSVALNVAASLSLGVAKIEGWPRGSRGQARGHPPGGTGHRSLYRGRLANLLRIVGFSSVPLPVRPHPSSIRGRSMPKTSRYRNSSAERALYWVPAASRPSVARQVRKRSTSAAPHLTWVATAISQEEAPDQRHISCSVRML